MAIGALVLGPVADRIGRRNMTIVALIVNMCGLFLSATATSAAQLGIWRVVTGLGIGGILVGTNVICAEYASRKRRGLVISIYTAGYGIGAALGGSVMISLIATSGWRSVFVLGGIMASISLVLVLLAHSRIAVLSLQSATRERAEEARRDCPQARSQRSG